MLRHVGVGLGLEGRGKGGALEGGALEGGAGRGAALLLPLQVPVVLEVGHLALDEALRAALCVDLGHVVGAGAGVHGGVRGRGHVRVGVRAGKAGGDGHEGRVHFRDCSMGARHRIVIRSNCEIYGGGSRLIKCVHGNLCMHVGGNLRLLG